MGWVWDQPGVSGIPQASKGELRLIPQNHDFPMAVGAGGSKSYTWAKEQLLEAAVFLPSLPSCSGWRKSPALMLELHVAFSLCNCCILIETSF